MSDAISNREQLLELARSLGIASARQEESRSVTQHSYSRDSRTSIQPCNTLLSEGREVPESNINNTFRNENLRSSQVTPHSINRDGRVVILRSNRPFCSEAPENNTFRNENLRSSQVTPHCNRRDIRMLIPPSNRPSSEAAGISDTFGNENLRSSQGTSVPQRVKAHRFQPQRFYGRTSSGSNEMFEVEQIIAVPSNHEENSLTPTAIGKLKRQGRVIDYVEFCTRSSEDEIKDKIRKLFPHLCDFEICRREGTLLNPPSLVEFSGSSRTVTKAPITGHMLKKFFHNRKMFIVPTSIDSDSDFDELEIPRKQPRRERKTPRRFGEIFELDSSGNILNYYDGTTIETDPHLEAACREQEITPKSTQETLADIIESLKPDSEGEKLEIWVTRNQVISSAISFLVDEIDFNRLLKVKFADLAGTEEGAADFGGPRREFFDQVIDEVLELPILTGELEKEILYIEEEYSRRMYYFVGLLLGLSLIQGGPAPTILTEGSFNQLISGVSDDENQNKAYQQFRSGLEAAGLLEKMLIHPEVFKVAFTAHSSVPSFMEFEEMLTYVRSPEESEDFKTENRIIILWQLLLRKMKNKQVTLTLPHILSFASGSKRLPALGFHKKLEILFNHANPTERLPLGGTCGLQLTLPVKRMANELDAFTEDMEFGIRNSLGTFGRI